MNPPRSEGFVRMPDAEFEAILTRAAEEGAKRALADVASTATRPRSTSAICAPWSTASGWSAAPRCRPPSA